MSKNPNWLAVDFKTFEVLGGSYFSAIHISKYERTRLYQKK